MLSIKRKTVWRGRTGNGKTYFHPRVTAFEDNAGKRLLMTLQEITGSDYYNHVLQSYSVDHGESWSEPRNIPSLGREDMESGIEEGVCDVVPDYHEKTGKVLAIGHNVYYRSGALYDTLGYFRPEEKSDSLRRKSVYSVRGSDGSWSERKELRVDEFCEMPSCVCGCSQKVFLPDGRIIVPFTILYKNRLDNVVCSAICDFDGAEITVLRRGGILELREGRGLLEPSMIRYGDKYYLTLRAEDGKGYVSVSDDGLFWAPIRPWKWENGETLEMSSTQQHWLAHNDKLYLVFTRRTDKNYNVVRWRSPLFLSEVDPSHLWLIMDSEREVFPLVGDGVNDPESVPLLGNFQAVSISASEAIVTDGEFQPYRGYKGDTLLAKISSV